MSDSAVLSQVTRRLAFPYVSIGRVQLNGHRCVNPTTILYSNNPSHSEILKWKVEELRLGLEEFLEGEMVLLSRLDRNWQPKHCLDIIRELFILNCCYGRWNFSVIWKHLDVKPHKILFLKTVTIKEMS